MLDDDVIEGSLASVRLEGPSHDHQRAVVKARLFGGEAPTRRIGRFVVRGELGRGGMGTVLEAYDEALDRAVAIKLVEDALRARHHDRLRREAQALARLSHPNVVTVHEVGVVEGRTFIVMELVRGVTLDRWQCKRRTWQERLDAYRQAGRGLAAAHSAGLVHRDFKPSNCIIDEQGRVRVLDFGLACELDEDGHDPASTHDSGPEHGDASEASDTVPQHRLTAPGALLGTRVYMAPEQRLRRVADARSDQFSFCVALYEALYGQLPFSDAAGARHTPLPPPPGCTVPGWLRRTVWRGLSARPADRWPSMSTLLRELDDRQRRARVRRAAGAGAGLVSLALAGLTAATPRDPPPCEDAPHELDGVWSPVRREQLGDAMLATEHPRAVHAWSVVRRQLDRYAADWAESNSQACKATRVHHEQPLEILELRRRCLAQRRTALRHHVELLVSGARQHVDDAVELVTRLPAIEPCNDVEALASRPGPRSIRDESEAAALRDELERLRALAAVEGHDEGLPAVEPLLLRARALEHPPLLAEALVLAGHLHAAAGDDEAAKEHFELARTTALPHEAGIEPAVSAMAASIHLLGVEQENAETALMLGSVAEALGARTGLDASLRAEVLTAVAQVQTTVGEHAEAERRYREAVEILEQQRGADHLALAGVLDGWATAAHRRGDRARADALYGRALAIREQWLGADHPAVAYQLANHAAVLVEDESRRDEALAHAERAVRILEAVQTPHHKRLGHVHANLGGVLSKVGRRDQAEAQMRLALEHYRLAGQAGHVRTATVRYNLARILEKRGHASEAVEQHRSALRILAEHERTPARDGLEALVRKRLERLLAAQGVIELPSSSSRGP